MMSFSAIYNNYILENYYIKKISVEINHYLKRKKKSNYFSEVAST